jgi:signal transduction histidine kinase
VHSHATRLATAIFVSTTALAVATSFAAWQHLRGVVLNGLDAALRARAEMLGAMCTWDEAQQELRFAWPEGIDPRWLLQRSPCDVEIRSAAPWRVLHRTGPELPRHGVGELEEGGPIDKQTRARFHTLKNENGAPRRMATVLVKRRVAGEDDPSGPITAGDAIVKIAVSMEPELEQLAVLSGNLVLASIVAALALAAIAHVVARRFSRPLMRLELAARHATPGQAFVFERSGREDEVERLAAVLTASFARYREVLERQARFTSDAAHELRNPLTAMRASSEVALRRERTREEYERFFVNVLETLEGAEQTLNALIELARLDLGAGAAPPLETVELGDVLAAACAKLELEARGRLAYTSSATSGSTILGRPQLLVVLFENLLRNALQYSPSTAAVDLSVADEEGSLRVEVRDRGIGLAPEEAERAFERFYRAPRSAAEVPGSGLGLSIAKAIAELHGGTIELHRAEPGTVARVRLPRAAT